MKMIQDDISLIKQAQSGSQAAFRELVCRYDRQVLNIAAAYRNNEEDAQDIYQEVFLRVYKGLESFQFRSSFSTWLFRITTNVCISYNDKKKKHKMESINKEISGSDGASIQIAEMIKGRDSADREILSDEISEKVNGLVETLPAQQKMAFTLKYFQEYKIKEIAKMMNCAEGTIKRYLFTASKKMRNELKNYV